MPVRSSVCAYSPSAVSSSSNKHSVTSLSIGHYKPLAGSTSSYSWRDELNSSSRLSRPSSSNQSRYQASLSKLPSSPSAASYISSPIQSGSIGSYRPLSISPSSYTSRLSSSGSSSIGTSSPRYSRYSSASSTSSTISSASAASDLSSSLLAYSSTYNHSPTSSSPSSYASLSSSSAALRRLSYTVSFSLRNWSDDRSFCFKNSLIIVALSSSITYLLQ